VADTNDQIVRARILEAQKAEQDRLGKEHLQNMLQRSTGLLEAHRDEMAGRGEDEDEDEDEVGSEGTEEVSAAEESEEEGGVDGDGDGEGEEANAEAQEVDDDEGDQGDLQENAVAEAGQAMDLGAEALAVDRQDGNRWRKWSKRRKRKQSWMMR
jgi:helicase SWR1